MIKRNEEQAIMRKCFLDSTHFNPSDITEPWVLIELHGDLASTTGAFEEKLKIGDIREVSTAKVREIIKLENRESMKCI